MSAETKTDELTIKKPDLGLEALKAGPMRGLPMIPRNLSSAEAQARRQVWQPPTIIPGEFVFWRKFQGTDEWPGFVTRTTNKTWTIFVAKPGGGFEEKGSVAYHDHTGEASENDPNACHNSNGTFRRTIFGKKIEEIFTLLNRIMGENAELRDAVMALHPKRTASNPGSSRPAQTQPELTGVK